MRILIADDDRSSRVLLSGMLSRWGYEVISASDGLEAWEVLRQEDAPGIAVLDWMMPGLDGVEVCQRAADLSRPCPPYLILLTSLNSKEDLVTGLDSGASDYIVKPFSHIELEARLRVGERVVRLQRALHERARELQDALDHVKTLQGILPICMHCKRVKTDEASWHRLESYIESHSDARFSHGLCPECLEAHYPPPQDDEPDDIDLPLP